MSSPAVLKLPEQKVMAWLPKDLAERKLRQGGELLQHRVAGFNKDMEPVYSYLVAYNRPRHIPRGSEKIIIK